MLPLACQRGRPVRAVEQRRFLQHAEAKICSSAIGCSGAMLEQCVAHLEDFKNKNISEEFDKAAEDLRLATRHLGIIVGRVDVEEILGSIFNDFCIGK